MEKAKVVSHNFTLDVQVVEGRKEALPAVNECPGASRATLPLQSDPNRNCL